MFSNNSLWIIIVNVLRISRLMFFKDFYYKEMNSNLDYHISEIEIMKISSIYTVGS